MVLSLFFLLFSFVSFSLFQKDIPLQATHSVHICSLDNFTYDALETI